VTLILAGQGPAAIELPPVQTLVPGLSSGQGDKPARSQLEKALAIFEKGQFDQCLQLLQEAKKQQPDLSPPRLILAQLFLSANRIAEGRENLELLAVENPNCPDLYVLFGQLALNQGSQTAADLFFEKAAVLPVPETWTMQRKRQHGIQIAEGRAAVARRRENWQAAYDALSTWLKLEPSNGRARERYAHALFKLGKATEAYKELQHAVKDDETLQPASLSMGWWYEEKGDHTTALKWMAYAVKLNPKNPKARQACAAVLLGQDKVQQAKAQADIAGGLDPDSKSIKMLRGLIARALGQYPDAEEIFVSLYRLSPADFEISNQLALALAEQGEESKQRQALELAEANLRRYADDPKALSTLGWVYYRLGRPAEAEQKLQAAASAGPVGAETSYFLARVLSEQGRADQAAKARQKLQAAIADTGIFVLRNEARQWLKQQRSDSSN